MEVQKSNIRYSITVVGSGGVGKSAITLAFIRNQFIEEYDPTIEDSYTKPVNVDGVECTLDITDTAGQEEYRGLWGDKFMRESDGFILVYSITSRHSFDELVRFRTDIFRAREGKKTPMVVLGNKRDLSKDRQVAEGEGLRFAQECKAVFMETSAKTNTNIENAFLNLVREIVKVKEYQQIKRSKESKNSKGKGGCCLIV